MCSGLRAHRIAFVSAAGLGRDTPPEDVVAAFMAVGLDSPGFHEAVLLAGEVDRLSSCVIKNRVLLCSAVCASVLAS